MKMPIISPAKGATPCARGAVALAAFGECRLHCFPMAASCPNPEQPPALLIFLLAVDIEVSRY
jgi:hypothetical protein